MAWGNLGDIQEKKNPAEIYEKGKLNRTYEY